MHGNHLSSCHREPAKSKQRHVGSLDDRAGSLWQKRAGVGMQYHEPLDQWEWRTLTLPVRDRPAQDTEDDRPNVFYSQDDWDHVSRLDSDFIFKLLQVNNSVLLCHPPGKLSRPGSCSDKYSDPWPSQYRQRLWRGSVLWSKPSWRTSGTGILTVPELSIYSEKSTIFSTFSFSTA